MFRLQHFKQSDLTHSSVCFYMWNQIIPYHCKSIEYESVEKPNNSPLCMQCQFIVIFVVFYCKLHCVLDSFSLVYRTQAHNKLTIVLYLFYLISSVILHFVHKTFGICQDKISELHAVHIKIVCISMPRSGMGYSHCTWLHYVLYTV